MGIEYRYVLAGVEAGKTVNKGGFQFTDGVHTHESEITNVEGLTTYLARSYNAHLAGSDALKAAEAEWTETQGGAKAPKAPAKAERMSIAEAVNALDPANDDHWTAAGLPQVDAVGGLVGSPVTRQQIDAAAKDFNRGAAKAAAAI